MTVTPCAADAFQYAGSELELFQRAYNWKAYWARHLAPYVHGKVLDVGAGIGANVSALSSPRVTGWTCLEPDGTLVETMRARQAKGELPANCGIRQGTLASLENKETFDTIVYIDVMEHIAEDRAEAARAIAHLAPGGRLVVLCPAHQYLFSPFDAAIGHHRRYSRAGMAALAPPGARVEMCHLLDSAGFFASLANKLLLRTAHPSAGQIALWDRVLVPMSRLVDPLLGYRFGKTVIAVFSRA